MSIKALLIDDEPLALRQLEAYARKTEQVEILGAFKSAKAAQPMVEQADVLFIDINMPDMSGLDFVRSLPQPPLIVFTTAYPQYAIEGFRVNAVDYLLKPFNLAEFQEAVNRVSYIINVEKAAHRQEDPGALQFKMDYKTVTVPINEICYVESMSEYVKIWVKGQATPLVVLYSLKRLVEQLPADRFMRIHRSYIISLSHIRAANATSVTIQGPMPESEVTLPVSESYRAAFRSLIR